MSAERKCPCGGRIVPLPTCVECWETWLGRFEAELAQSLRRFPGNLTERAHALNQLLADYAEATR